MALLAMCPTECLRCLLCLSRVSLILCWPEVRNARRKMVSLVSPDLNEHVWLKGMPVDVTKGYMDTLQLGQEE